ncbi:protein LITTLE ZIPPER 2-like isoform X2 [Impatiens glandulifera]|uniref:protein LITTLE ZIPPER 2-like isoform X2 n=1 Tax=Impatiens glandulifera TaxID=253017 RepID=UPI001FB14CA7|nr:protein LITTLE ZIPPER 2-like isoform X2 [Impatiens glandulifera]
MCIGRGGTAGGGGGKIIGERIRLIKRYKLRVRRLSSRQGQGMRERIRGEVDIGEIKREKEMEMQNLKLYMENMSILEANNMLRKKAAILYQENVALMSQFHNKFPSPNTDIQ